MNKRWSQKMAFLLSIIMCLPLAQPVYASSTNSNGAVDKYDATETWPITRAYFLDGELYIEVEDSYSCASSPISSESSSTIGVCPSTYRSQTVTRSRQQLITLRNKLESNGAIASIITGFLLSPTGPIISALGSAWAGADSMLLSAVKKALDTNKSSFQVSSKWKCVQVNMGSRGIVHHYKLVSVTIK